MCVGLDDENSVQSIHDSGNAGSLSNALPELVP